MSRPPHQRLGPEEDSPSLVSRISLRDSGREGAPLPGDGRTTSREAALPDLDEVTADLFLKDHFIFEKVWRAFRKLDPRHGYIAYTMIRELYGALVDPIDHAISVIVAKHGTGPGPYWNWRTFPQFSGSQIVSIHPLNGDPPFILDFAIPNSTRPRMFKFESLVPAGFDPSIDELRIL